MAEVSIRVPRPGLLDGAEALGVDDFVNLDFEVPPGVLVATGREGLRECGRDGVVDGLSAGARGITGED